MQLILLESDPYVSYSYNPYCDRAWRERIYMLLPPISVLVLSSLRFEITHSKELLQDLLGVQILGFRAPRFRLCDRGLDIVSEAGYKYDSSFISEKSTHHDQENVSVDYLRPGLAELPFKKHK